MEPANTSSPRQINPPGPLYDAVAERAADEGTSVVAVIIRYLTAYAEGKVQTPRLLLQFPTGKTAPVPDPEALRHDQQRLIETRVTSFRIDDGVWEDAQARAKAELLPLSAVMNRFLRGYAEHVINTP